MRGGSYPSIAPFQLLGGSDLFFMCALISFRAVETVAEVECGAGFAAEAQAVCSPFSPYLSKAVSVLSDCSMCSPFSEVLKREY